MADERNYWQRQLSRRRMLQGAALGGASLAAAAVIGCGEEEKPAATATAAPATTPAGAATPRAASPAATPTPAAAQPKRGGTLTHSQNLTATPVLDPQIDSPVISAYTRMINQGLLTFDDRTFDPKPELAQKWEQPSQTELIFTLQPGVKWHNKPPVNGRELTVDDVVFSLNRVRTNNPRFTNRGLLADVEKIEAVDKSRVRVTTKSPDAAFLAKLTGNGMAMVAKELLEKLGAVNEAIKAYDADSAIGTGPFIAKTLTENGPAEYTRNPDYWKKDRPYLDTLRALPLNQGQGNERSWAAFQGGQVDVTVVPGAEVKKWLATNPKWKEWTGDLTPYSVVPNTKVKPYDDARVTKALRLLVDHHEAIPAWAETWGGRGEHGGFLPANLATWELPPEEYEKFPEWKKDKADAVKEAIALFSAAGFTKDNPLKVEITTSTTPAFESMGLLLDGQYRRLGQGVVQTTIRKLEGIEYQTARANRNYSFMMSTNATAYHDPDAWWFTVYWSKAPRNYWNHSDPELDALFEKQRTLFKAEERKAFTKDIIRKMVEKWPGTSITQLYALNAIKDKVQGFAPELWFHGRKYEEVWLSA